MSARILIVDDIQANLDVLEVKLNLHYYEVLTTNRGKKAIEMAKNEHPDLIILDIMMPDLDGFEVCKALKADPETVNIPVIMLTALSDREHKLKGLEAGAEDFLSKPIQDRALLTRIKSLIRAKMTMDESLFRSKLSEKISGTESVALHDVKIDRALIFLCSANKAEVKNILRALERDALDLQSFKCFSELEAALTIHKPELIMLDLHHTEEDILKHVAHIRASERTRALPILGLADDDDTENLIKALDLGLNDYVMRPLDPYEIYVRVRGQIRRWRYHLNLLESYKENVTNAYLDPLTQVYNRRYVITHLENLLEQGEQHHKTFSLLMIDVDQFKAINDSQGHQEGDKVLKEIAFKIKDTVRDFDLVSRFGGEEFLVILPETDLDKASIIAERMREKIAETGHTVSIGVMASEKGLTLEALVSELDKAMYAAKHEGGNKVCHMTSLSEASFKA